MTEPLGSMKERNPEATPSMQGPLQYLLEKGIWSLIIPVTFQGDFGPAIHDPDPEFANKDMAVTESLYLALAFSLCAVHSFVSKWHEAGMMS